MARTEMYGNWPVYLTGFALVVATSGVSVLPPLITKSVIDEVIPTQRLGTLVWYGVEYLAIFVLVLALGYLRDLCFVHLSNRLYSSLQASVVERFLKRGLDRATPLGHGDFVARLSNDLNTVVSFETSALVELTSQAITFCFSVTVLVAIDPRLMSIIVIPIPILVLNSQALIRTFRRTYQAQRKAESLLADRLLESSTNLPALWTSGAWDYQKERIVKAQNERKRTSIQLFLISSARDAMSSVVTFVPPFLLLFLGAVWVIQGSLSIGAIVASMSFVGRIYAPVRSITGFSSRLSETNIAAGRVDEVMRSVNIEPVPSTPPDVTKSDLSVVFDNVSLILKDGKRVTKVFRNLNLAIRGVGIFWVSGKNGIGKTSLLGLACGLLVPDEGAVFIGREPATSIARKSIDRQIAIASQTDYIFSDTLKRNILLGTDDPGRKLDQLYVALGGDIVFDHRSLDQEIVAESLSGGQKKLVSLLRCAMQDAPIVFLDEPFSGLDNMTRQAVGSWISEMSLTKLVVVIEHDRSSFERHVTTSISSVQVDLGSNAK